MRAGRLGAGSSRTNFTVNKRRRTDGTGRTDRWETVETVGPTADSKRWNRMRYGLQWPAQGASGPGISPPFGVMRPRRVASETEGVTNLTLPSA